VYPRADSANGEMQSNNPGQSAPKRYDGRDGGPVYDPSHGGHFGKPWIVCCVGELD